MVVFALDSQKLNWQSGLRVGALLLLVFVAWRIGKKWRKQYAGALEFRAHLENTVTALTEQNVALKAQVSQNVNVSVGSGDGASARIGDDVGSVAGASRGVGVGGIGAVLPRSPGGIPRVQEVADSYGDGDSPPALSVGDSGGQGRTPALPALPARVVVPSANGVGGGDHGHCG